MNYQPVISVVVAIYNAEKHLKRCVDSILTQNFTDLEVLLIDDGSVDGSGKICDEYADQDSRVRVFHNINQGVGSTRHFGVEQACGEYIIHVDSDDWIDANFLSELYQCSQQDKADIVICDYIAERGSVSERISQQITGRSSSQVFLDVLRGSVGGTCWNKLVRATCYREHKINFVQGLNCGEDLVLVASLLQQDLTISYCPSTCYHYDLYTSDNSYMRHIKRDTLLQKEKALSLLFDINTYEENEVYILSKLHAVAYQAIRISAYSPQEYHEKFGRLKKLPFSATPNHPLQERIFVWISLHLGYRTSRFLMRMKLLYRRLMGKEM